MCGRFTLHLSRKKLIELLELEIPEHFDPDYNITPGREIITIANDQNALRAIGRMHWGLKTPQNFHINARLESADTSPRFRESWADYHCLIPATGYYEWYQDGITKQPYYFCSDGEEIIYFAALWFPPAFEGAPAPCVILTTEAHSAHREIHDRMPVILNAEHHESWLSNKLKKQELQAHAARVELQKHAVSHRVNSVHHNDSRLIEATAPQTDDQMRLF